MNSNNEKLIPNITRKLGKEKSDAGKSIIYRKIPAIDRRNKTIINRTYIRLGQMQQKQEKNKIKI